MPRDRNRRRLAAALLLVLAGPTGARADAAADPDWPCVQRKVATLSAAQMWPVPMPEPTEAERAEARALAEVARRMASRRVPVEEVTAEARDLVAGLEGKARARELAAFFEAIVVRINVERGQVISGIGRYARRQAALSDEVEARQLELARLEAAPEAARDATRIEALRTALAWDTRIFRERQQSLAFVCEAPTLLERRAFTLGRALGGLL